MREAFLNEIAKREAQGLNKDEAVFQTGLVLPTFLITQTNTKS